MTSGLALIFGISVALNGFIIAAGFAPERLSHLGNPTQRLRYTVVALCFAVGVYLPGELMVRLGLRYDLASVYDAWWSGLTALSNGEFTLETALMAPVLSTPYYLVVAALISLIHIYRKPSLFANYAGGGMYASTASVRAESEGSTVTLSFYKKIDGVWVLYVCEPSVSDDVAVASVEPLEDVNALTQKSGRAGNDN